MVVNKNLNGFFLVNYKLFLIQEKADAQAKLDKVGEYGVTYHPPLSEKREDFEGYKGVEKIEWGNPALYRKSKPKPLSSLLEERGRQIESRRAILSPLGAVMMMREYYEN